MKWYNLHNFTQVKYTLAEEIIDMGTGAVVRPWQIAYLEQKKEPAKAGKLLSELSEDALTELLSGFEYADGVCTDENGNLYFCDSRWKRIFRLDAESGDLRLIRDVMGKPLSMFTDTAGNLIVISEFRYPAEATKDGVRMKFQKPADASGTSYGIWYIPDAVVLLYSIDPEDPEHSMRLLPKVKTASLGSVKQAMHPANRWRDDNSYLDFTVSTPEDCYLAPDGVTVIPDFYDLIRSTSVLPAIPGERFFASDEYYKRVIEFTVRENGLLSDPKVFCEHGEYSIALDRERGRLYVGEGDILVYSLDGELLQTIKTPARVTGLAIGGKEKDILFVCAVGGVYAVRI